jgi:hypothetical protein
MARTYFVYILASDTRELYGRVVGYTSGEAAEAFEQVEEAPFDRKDESGLAGPG